ncbi:MAG: NHLM bacteriocin system ABC transporter ATP-binding protein [Minisyncoccia bacterium]|jgi:NHLM bacteriocin system ABC transporter ATP-binding protein
MTDSTIALNDPGLVWIVQQGTVDLFLAPADLTAPTAWMHVGRVGDGGYIPGCAPVESSMLIARPTPGSDVSAVSMAEMAHTDVATIAAGIDPLLSSLALALATQARPLSFELLDDAQVVTIGATGCGSISAGVRWLVSVEGDATLHRWGTQTSVELNRWVTPADWIEATGETACRTVDTADLDADIFDIVGVELTAWLTRAVGYRVELDELERERTRQRALSDQRLTGEAQHLLAEVMSGVDDNGADTADSDPAFAAVSLVGNLLGIQAKHASSADLSRRTDPVSAVVQASHVRERTVRLEANWYKKDVGPLVGFLKANMQPVCLRRKRRGYVIDDPVAGTTSAVNAETNRELYFEARMLYAPLPEHNLNGWGLLRFGAIGSGGDVITLGLTGLLVAVLGLSTPILTGRILGTLVPSADRHQITQWSVVLIAVAFVIATVSVVQNFAALRLEGRVDMYAQAGIWDRLMSLPTTFFRRNSIGELSAASLGVNGIRDLMSGLAVQSLLAFIMALANLGLMIYYDATLGLLAFVVILAGAALSVKIGLDQVKVQRTANDQLNALSSTTFQLMSGMAKLRVAAAEDRAFSYWSHEFVGLRQLMIRTRSIQNRLLVFNAGYLVIAPALVFAYIGLVRNGDFPVSTFLSFNVAFLLLLAATLRLTGTGITLLNAVPMFEKLKPILDSQPEILSDDEDPGELLGKIEVRNLNFSYEEGLPPVLTGISLIAEPGEFVAIVGPSGCGKSTLLRMLLGFETPTNGSVLFDGQHLESLDVGAVRRQCGVVLQQGQLFAGDILSNIIGSSTYTVEDAWEAAEMAGMKADIEHMPMGMNTLLSEGASTLSGGQRQRLMIARAFISRPRIVFFDEATSALDNETQAIVTESMRQMNATRIVIAHRLSTIRDADRIVVIEAGRLVQNGTYDELIEQDGLFKSLAKRQIA